MKCNLVLDEAVLHIIIKIRADTGVKGMGNGFQ
jgi:hypothetical protein